MYCLFIAMNRGHFADFIATMTETDWTKDGGNSGMTGKGKIESKLMP